MYFFVEASTLFHVPQGSLFSFNREDEIDNILLKKKIKVLLFVYRNLQIEV